MLSETNTTESFSTDWENMSGKDIAKVLIMTHGKNQSIKVGDGISDQFTSTGGGKTNISGTEVPNIQDLPQPKGNIKNADSYMYSCHSADSSPKRHGEGGHLQGELKGSKRPIAYVFAQYFNFKRVFGTAESVNYLWFYLIPYPSNGGKWLYYDRKK